MSMIKIAVAGMSQVGKLEIFKAIQRIDPSVRLESPSTERRDHLLRVSCDDREFVPYTLHGSFIPWREPIKGALHGAALVVYVIKSLPERHQAQQMFLNMYAKIAVECGCFWDTTPWLWVLNKIDLFQANPLHETVPETQQRAFFRCDARSNVGIPELWHSIKTTAIASS